MTTEQMFQKLESRGIYIERCDDGRYILTNGDKSLFWHGGWHTNDVPESGVYKTPLDALEAAIACDVPVPELAE